MHDVYALLDSSGTVKYVGSTADVRARHSAHWANRHVRDTPVYKWLQSCDEPPAYRVLEIVDDHLAVDAEQYWITFFKFIGGLTLLNVRDAGPNGKFHVKRAPISGEARRKISEASSARERSDEARENHRQGALKMWERRRRQAKMGSLDDL